MIDGVVLGSSIAGHICSSAHSRRGASGVGPRHCPGAEARAVPAGAALCIGLIMVYFLDSFAK